MCNAQMISYALCATYNYFADSILIVMGSRFTHLHLSETVEILLSQIAMDRTRVK